MYALTPAGLLILTGEASRAIAAAQSAGNRVRWQDDKVTWGIAEKWAYPKQVGRTLFEDCDGISLYKSKLLRESGVPASVLLMTICLAPDGQGHAVLCIPTDMGDLILCNNHPFVTTPATMQREGYKFLYRQGLGRHINEPWDVLK